MASLSKKIIVGIFILTLTACASITGYHYYPPKDEQSVSELITYEVEKFDKSAWLSTGIYWGEFEGGYVGVMHSYRAKYDSNNNLQFIQLYMTLRSSDWYFMNNVEDTKGTNFDFVKIDKEVISGGYIHETFAITITKNQLEEFAKADQLLKVSGKHSYGVFTLSKYLSSAFLKSINEKK